MKKTLKYNDSKAYGGVGKVFGTCILSPIGDAFRCNSIQTTQNTLTFFWLKYKMSELIDDRHKYLKEEIVDKGFDIEAC